MTLQTRSLAGKVVRGMAEMRTKMAFALFILLFSTSIFLPPFSNSSWAGCPAGMEPLELSVRRTGRIHRYCIDRYEASLEVSRRVQVNPQNCTEAWEPWPANQNPGQTFVRAVSRPGVKPQGYISQIQARQACERAGKRLCTSSEWLRACKGARGAERRFPYGQRALPGVCSDRYEVARRHPARTLHRYNYTAFLKDPAIFDLPDGVAPTGLFSQCSTPEGVYDLVGNLHEWVADSAGVFRGGFFVLTLHRQYGEGCDFVIYDHNTSYWDYSTGFRCCKDGE